MIDADKWFKKNEQKLKTGHLSDEALLELLSFDFRDYKDTQKFAVFLGNVIMEAYDNPHQGKVILYDLNRRLIQLMIDPKTEHYINEHTMNRNDSVAIHTLFNEEVDSSNEGNLEDDRFTRRKKLLTGSIEQNLIAYEYSLDHTPESHVHKHFDDIKIHFGITKFSRASAPELDSAKQGIITLSKVMEKIRADIADENAAKEQEANADREAKANAKEQKANENEKPKPKPAILYKETYDELNSLLARIKPEHTQLKSKVSTLMDTISEEKKDYPAKEHDLTTILNETCKLLKKGKTGVKNYNTVVETMKEQSKVSPGIFILMGLIGALVAVSGVILIASGAAAPLGVGMAVSGGVTMGTALIAGRLFSGEKHTRLSKGMKNVSRETTDKENLLDKEPPKGGIIKSQ